MKVSFLASTNTFQQLACLAAWTALVGCTGAHYGPTPRTLAAKHVPQASLATPECPLAPAGTSLHSPSLAHGAPGNAVARWQRDVVTNLSIWTQRQ